MIRYVYLFRRADGCYKIGSSKHPDVRIKQLSPRPEEIVHTFPSTEAYGVEFALQRRFAERFVKGEWFALQLDEVRLICGLVRVDTASDLPPNLQPPPDVLIPGRSGRYREPTQSIQVRLPLSVVAAIERMAKANRRTIRQEVTISIEDRLQTLGYWPSSS